MRKLLLIILLVLFLMSCATREIDFEQLEGRDGVYYAEDEDKPYSGKVTGLTNIGFWGKIDLKKSEATLFNGQLDGLFRIWFENGQLISESTYVRGKQEGLSRYWYENRQVAGEVSYVDGKMEGLGREWYENGQLSAEVTYVNDKREGLSREWYEDGQLLSERNYVEGKCVSGCK